MIPDDLMGRVNGCKEREIETNQQNAAGKAVSHFDRAGGSAFAMMPTMAGPRHSSGGRDE